MTRYVRLDPSHAADPTVLAFSYTSEADVQLQGQAHTKANPIQTAGYEVAMARNRRRVRMTERPDCRVASCCMEYPSLR